MIRAGIIMIHGGAQRCEIARLITFNPNLNTEIHGGGLPPIQEDESGSLVHGVANIGVGDAILFRILPKLRHRASALEGKNAETLFASRFKSQPSYLKNFEDLREATVENQSFASPQK